MPLLTVFNKEENKEPVVRLRSVLAYGGCVDWMAVDENGKTVSAGTLLTLCPDGYIELSKGVNPLLGLKLDSEGRIVIRI
jgi:hypothetical protein